MTSVKYDIAYTMNYFYVISSCCTICCCWSDSFVHEAVFAVNNKQSPILQPFCCEDNFSTGCYDTPVPSKCQAKDRRIVAVSLIPPPPTHTGGGGCIHHQRVVDEAETICMKQYSPLIPWDLSAAKAKISATCHFVFLVPCKS